MKNTNKKVQMQIYPTKMTPWNRPEDAKARELFKTHLQNKLEEAANSLDRITAEDYSYTPEIFKEVSEEEAYEMYWSSMTEDERDEWSSMTEDERDEQLNYRKR